jgi:hypothetical protein
VQARRADAATLDFAPHELAGALPAWSGADAWSPLAYEYSGLENHPGQTTAGSQPKLVTDGGYVGGLEFGTGADMNLLPPAIGLSDFFIFTKIKLDAGTGTQTHYVTNSGGNSRVLIRSTTTGAVLVWVAASGTVTLPQPPL